VTERLPERETFFLNSQDCAPKEIIGAGRTRGVFGFFFPGNRKIGDNEQMNRKREVNVHLIPHRSGGKIAGKRRSFRFNKNGRVKI